MSNCQRFSNSLSDMLCKFSAKFPFQFSYFRKICEIAEVNALSILGGTIFADLNFWYGRSLDNRVASVPLHYLNHSLRSSLPHPAPAPSPFHIHSRPYPTHSPKHTNEVNTPTLLMLLLSLL